MFESGEGREATTRNLPFFFQHLRTAAAEGNYSVRQRACPGLVIEQFSSKGSDIPDIKYSRQG